MYFKYCFISIVINICGTFKKMDGKNSCRTVAVLLNFMSCSSTTSLRHIKQICADPIPALNWPQNRFGDGAFRFARGIIRTTVMSCTWSTILEQCYFWMWSSLHSALFLPSSLNPTKLKTLHLLLAFLITSSAPSNSSSESNGSFSLDPSRSPFLDLNSTCTSDSSTPCLCLQPSCLLKLSWCPHSMLS